MGTKWVQNLKQIMVIFSDMAVERPPFFGSSLARSEPAVHQLPIPSHAENS